MNLTDEQIEILKKTYIDLALSAMKFQEEVMKAFVPVIEATSAFYDAVPEEMKQEIAATQVKEMMDKANIDALKSTKEKFIANKLKEYEKFWNPQKMKYEIDLDWSPSRKELLEDLEKSWEFENGEKS